MKNQVEIGDKRSIEHVVNSSDMAAFDEKIIHKVCSTFALAREIERSSRQFMPEICEEDEEGIGTMLTIDHKSPAFLGERLLIEAIIIELNDNELICNYIAKVNDRIIATGKTGQKVLKRHVIEKIFSNFGSDGEER